MKLLSSSSMRTAWFLFSFLVRFTCSYDSGMVSNSNTSGISLSTVDIPYSEPKDSRHNLPPNFTIFEPQHTSNSRTLTQRRGVSPGNEQYECLLSRSELRRYYNNSLQQWFLDDRVLQEINNDIQAIINCTAESDVIVLTTSQTITPRSSLTLPWNVAIRGGSTSTRITCPRRGPLFIANAPSLILEGFTITGCNVTSSIFVMNPVCNEDNTEYTTFLGDMILEDNSIFEEAHIIDSTNSSCSQLDISNTLFRRNRCMGTHCVALGGRARMTNIQLVRNQGSPDASLDSSIFSADQESEIVAVNLTARKNFIRSFQILNGSLSLTQSVFRRNARSELGTTEDSLFESNYGPQGGGGVFALASELNITNCAFHENDVGEGNGGALYTDSNSTLYVSSSSFSQNKGHYGSGIYSNLNFKTQVIDSSFSENNSSRSGGIYIVNGEVSITSSEFLNNSANQSGSALLVVLAELDLKNSTFVGNQASVGGACLFEEFTKAQAEDLIFQNNVAFGSNGGGITLSLWTQLTIQDSLFHSNRALGNGGGIQAEGESQADLNRVQFVNNTAGRDGGAMEVLSGNWTGLDLQFTNNTARLFGGAVVFQNTTSVSVSNMTCHDNKAEYGGAIMLLNVSYSQATEVSFVRNAVQVSGGAVYVQMSNFDCLSCSFEANNAWLGGAILLGDLTKSIMSNSTFTRNAGSEGAGAISCSGIGLQISASSFQGNQGRAGGAITATSKCNISISETRFQQNVAQVGGCLHLQTNVNATVTSSAFINNNASIRGGVFSASDNCALSLSNCTLLENNCGSQGGNIYIQNNSSLVLFGVRSIRNTANFGGSLHISDSCTATISNCSFENNTGASSGGSVHIMSHSNISITHSTFSRNIARFGGGLSITTNCYARLLRCLLIGNVASDWGGGAFLNGSTISLLSSQMDLNHASLGGALLGFGSILRLRNLNITKSHVNNSGGGIYMENTNATMVLVYLEANRALRECGGILARESNIDATRAVILSNSAKERGGGICVSSASSLVCYLCQIHHNRAHSGAGLFAYSNNSIPIVAQFQDSSFENNTALSYGGGIEFDAPHNISTECSDPSVTCGHVILLNTSFVDNYANHSGAAVLTTDASRVLISCEYNQTRNTHFLTEQDFSSLETIYPKRLCQNWRRNRISSEAYGDIVGTYGQEILLSIVPDGEVRLTRNKEGAQVLENVNSGRQLPTIQITVLDGFGVGPAPTNPFTFEASLSSPNDFFQGAYTANITAGSGSFSRVVGLTTPGNYSIKFTFESVALEPLIVKVLVRRCQVGEEPTNDELTCQECDSVHYNFNPEQPEGCKLCHENANCTGRFIVPKEGYWHRSPCHDNVKECLTEEACIYDTRQVDLANFTQNFTDCDFNKTEVDTYGNALCNKGYKGLLCGSCENSYGLSLTFKCLQCPRRFVSFLTLIVLTLYLLCASAITIRGSLPISTKKQNKGSVRSSTAPLASSHDANTQIEMSTINIEQQQQALETSSSEDSSPRARTLNPQKCNAFEITRWRTTEIFKIMINFLQSTAVASTVNVSWPSRMLDFFEASEYAGALTSTAVSGPVDCIASSKSAPVKAIWRMLFSLFVPGIVIALFGSFWISFTLMKKKGMKYYWKRVLLSLIVVVYISYLGLTKMAFRGFYCVQVYDTFEPSNDNKHRFWATDTSIKCFTKDHSGIIAISVVVLFFISVSFPLLSAYLLITNKEGRKERDSWIFETTGFLFRAFKEGCSFWESVVLIRKALLSVVVVFSYPLGGHAQGLLALLILLISLHLHFTVKPFRKEFAILNHFESGSITVSCLTFTLGLFFADERSTQSVRAFLTVTIISANTLFLAFLLFALFYSVLDHIRVELQYHNVQVSDQTPWWKVLKIYISKKTSK